MQFRNADSWVFGADFVSLSFPSVQGLKGSNSTLSNSVFNQHVIPIPSHALAPCVGSHQFLDSND